MLLSLKNLKISQILTLFFGILFILGIAISVFSSIPVRRGHTCIQRIIINEQIKMSPKEQRRYCLGFFEKNCNISIRVYEKTGKPVIYEVIIYNGLIISNISSIAPESSFRTNNNYYELVLINNSTNYLEIYLNATAEEPYLEYPYWHISWIGKNLLLIGGLGFVIQTLWLKHDESLLTEVAFSRKPHMAKFLLAATISSFLFWSLIITLPSFSSLGLENWYTDHIRHSYTAFLFLKYHFSVFSVPLGSLANNDDSFFKFITWAKMPHLYPLGSIALFLPFGIPLQFGVPSELIFKLEIATFVFFGHVCIYLFGKMLLENGYMHKITKIAVFSFFYYIVVLYSLNGMFDSIPVLFSILALSNLIKKRYEASFLFLSIGFLFKYQVAIFLLPLFLINFLNIFTKKDLLSILRNAKITAAFLFIAVSSVSLIESLPYILNVRENLIMNPLYLFRLPVNVSWVYHLFALSVVLIFSFLCVFFSFKRNRTFSAFISYLLLPFVSLPYFQPWYFMYVPLPALLIKDKRFSALFVVWLVTIALLIAC